MPRGGSGVHRDAADAAGVAAIGAVAAGTTVAAGATAAVGVVYDVAALPAVPVYSSGTISSATMLMILISGLMAGPAVSL